MVAFGLAEKVKHQVELVGGKVMKITSSRKLRLHTPVGGCIGNQRRFPRSDSRRLSFALIAQRLGLTLAQIQAELAALPQGRAPTREDWHAMSQRLRGTLAERITMLERTRDLLDGCIGCGCLSLDRCALYNPGDRAARAGAGPRFLLGDRASDFAED